MRITHALNTMKLAHSIKRPLMFWGPPGIGKSTMVKQYAVANSLELIDWRLTLMDTVDMRGTPREKNGYTSWAPPIELPREGDKPGILLLDELPQARMEVKNVAAMLVLEGRIGEWKLPKGWWVVGAGNRAGDAAGTSPMPTHLNNRFWHVDIELNYDDFFAWAEANDLDYRTIAFLKYSDKALLDFDPKSKEAAFATPRSWEGVSDIVKALGSERDILALDPPVLSEMISGNVGRAWGEQFVGFMRVMHSLVSMEQIKRDPKNAPIPQEPSVKYAIATGLTRSVKKAEVANAFEYMLRMGKEMTFVFARKLELEQPELRKTASFVQFCASNADYI